MATPLYGHTPASTYSQLLYIEPAPAANTANVRQDNSASLGAQLVTGLDLPITGSQANFLRVTGAAAAGTVALAVVGSDTNANLSINAKGSGTIAIGSVSTGAVTITPATTVTGLLTASAGVTLTGTLTMATAVSILVPGATSFAIRNNANGQNNLLISNAGIVNLINKFYPSTDAAAVQSACGLYAGTGAPNNANGSNGDFYFRSDGGALTRIYYKAAGAWAGVV